LKELWRSDRSEFVVAMAAFVGVLTFGLLDGVMIGAAISLVQLVRASSHPHVALLDEFPAPVFLGSRPPCRQRTDSERDEFSGLNRSWSTSTLTMFAM